MRAGGPETIPLSDAYAIQEAFAEEVVGVAPVAQERFQIRSGSTNFQATVVGTWPDFAKVRNAEPEKGSFFTWDDVTAKRRVAVLGYGVAEDLFGTDDPWGSGSASTGSRSPSSASSRTRGTRASSARTTRSSCRFPPTCNASPGPRPGSQGEHDLPPGRKPRPAQGPAGTAHPLPRRAPRPDRPKRLRLLRREPAGRPGERERHDEDPHPLPRGSRRSASSSEGSGS